MKQTKIHVSICLDEISKDFRRSGNILIFTKVRNLSFPTFNCPIHNIFDAGHKSNNQSIITMITMIMMITMITF